MGAITSVTIAATVFVVVLVIGSGGAAQVARVFTPIAVAATVLSLVFGILAVANARLRAIGVTTLIVTVPCILLSLLSLIALLG